MNSSKLRLLLCIFLAVVCSITAYAGRKSQASLSFQNVSGGVIISWPSVAGADVYSITLKTIASGSFDSAITWSNVVGTTQCFVPNLNSQSTSSGPMMIRSNPQGPLAVDIVAYTFVDFGIAETFVASDVQHIFQGMIGTVTGSGTQDWPVAADGKITMLFPASGGKNGTGCLIRVGDNVPPHVVVNFPPLDPLNPNILSDPYKKVYYLYGGLVFGMCAKGGAHNTGGVFTWDPTLGETSAAFQFYSKTDIVDINERSGLGVVISRDGGPVATSDESGGFIAVVNTSNLSQLDVSPAYCFNDMFNVGRFPTHIEITSTGFWVRTSNGGGQGGGSLTQFLYPAFSVISQVALSGPLTDADDPSYFDPNDLYDGLLTQRYGVGSALLVPRIANSSGAYPGLPTVNLPDSNFLAHCFAFDAAGSNTFDLQGVIEKADGSLIIQSFGNTLSTLSVRSDMSSDRDSVKAFASKIHFPRTSASPTPIVVWTQGNGLVGKFTVFPQGQLTPSNGVQTYEIY